jgi:hypothetical protein
VSEEKQKENRAAVFAADLSVTAAGSLTRRNQSIPIAIAPPRFDRIDPCTQFSRLQSATGMPIENAGNAQEDEEPSELRS